MGQLVRWNLPPTDPNYTSVQIERATVQEGPYTLIATQTSSDNTYFDTAGTNSSWYRVRFTDGTNNSDYSVPLKGNSSVGYVELNEVRAMLKLQPAEYSDDDIQFFINKATKRVDEEVDRTWRGIFEVRNEFYDGVDSQILYLNETDVREVLEIGVDNTNNGTFTVLTPVQVTLYDEGKVVIDQSRNSALPVKSFAKGFKNIRISYKYGNQVPTEAVKELCLLYIAQFIKQDPTRKEMIDKLVTSLRFKRPNLV